MPRLHPGEPGLFHSANNVSTLADADSLRDGLQAPGKTIATDVTTTAERALTSLFTVPSLPKTRTPNPEHRTPNPDSSTRPLQPRHRGVGIGRGFVLSRRSGGMTRRAGAPPCPGRSATDAPAPRD